MKVIKHKDGMFTFCALTKEEMWTICDAVEAFDPPPLSRWIDDTRDELLHEFDKAGILDLGPP